MGRTGTAGGLGLEESFVDSRFDVLPERVFPIPEFGYIISRPF
jgi:hypothetical protein